MTDSHLFWTVFAAILGANLLTVCFIWSCVKIAKLESRDEGYLGHLGGVLLPLAFLFAGIYTVIG